jgi:hypothetical protein
MRDFRGEGVLVLAPVGFPDPVEPEPASPTAPESVSI